MGAFAETKLLGEMQPLGRSEPTALPHVLAVCLATHGLLGHAGKVTVDVVVQVDGATGHVASPRRPPGRAMGRISGDINGNARASAAATSAPRFPSVPR